MRYRDQLAVQASNCFHLQQGQGSTKGKWFLTQESMLVQRKEVKIVLIDFEFNFESEEDKKIKYWDRTAIAFIFKGTEAWDKKKGDLLQNQSNLIKVTQLGNM